MKNFYLCLALALSACAMDPSEDESLGENEQGLYVADGTSYWPRYSEIPMCFLYSSGDTAIPIGERAAITGFIKERILLTWGAVLPFYISFRDCPTTGTARHVMINLFWKKGGGACTAGPDGLTTPDQRAVVTPETAGCGLGIPPDWRSNQNRLLSMQKYVLHEFGHVLGFEHEFHRPDAAGHPCAVPHAPTGGLMIGDYDERSIMLSTYHRPDETFCAGQIDQSWLSPNDVINARYLYASRTPPSSVKDIVWQGPTGGASIWRMSGALMAYEYYIPDTEWSAYRIIGGGDFDGDGIGDLLWRGPDGAVVIWLLNADGTMRESGYKALSKDYVFQGIARFNRTDTRSDVLWRNSRTGGLLTWMMNGKLIGYSREMPSTDTNWQIKQIGDFNGDGTADLFWRHPFGPTSVWLMDDGAIIAPVQPYVDVPTSWTVMAAGDFDGNRKTDLFWQNTDGRTSIWFMNGATAGGYGTPRSVAQGWKVRAAADVDADGMTDLIWRNPDESTGLWIMNGAAIREDIPLPSVPTSYNIVGVLQGTMNPSY